MVLRALSVARTWGKSGPCEWRACRAIRLAEGGWCSEQCKQPLGIQTAPGRFKKAVFGSVCM